MLERARKTNISNEKANRGYVFLKGDKDLEQNMVGYAYAALLVFVSRFSSDTSGVPRSQAKLTELSMAIGRQIIKSIAGKKLTASQEIQVGDCFVGGFHEAGFINIYRDESYASFAKSAPYIVEATMYFEELKELPDEFLKNILTATQGTKIKDIDGVLQGHNRPLIKGFYAASDDTQTAYTRAITQGITKREHWVTAVNNLQQTAWKINTEVLEIVNKQFDRMMKDVPPKPNVITKEEVKIRLEALKQSDTPKNREKYNEAVRLWNLELESIIPASKNVETSIIKAKANALAEMDEFYQYVELDYRGRVYIQEPFMNYQGNDMARGLLQFAEGKPLGKDGVKWLAIHTAVSYNQTYNKDELPDWLTTDYSTLLEEHGLESISVDKMSLEDRELWTYHNMEKIQQDSGGLVECEKPVAYLAACLEWSKIGYSYNKTDEGLLTFLTTLPIPIDGSCNGYQHSAAIAKDEVTGSLVSLVPQDVQEDLYVVVAKALIAKVKQGTRLHTLLSSMPMKDIRKGITKRAVMTRAYSAGKEKIADSMYKDCHQFGFTDTYGITMMDCVELGSLIYDVIKEVCPGATRTMEFLQHLATYELGVFETRDKHGKKVSKSKRKRLYTKKHKLNKIKDPTNEELLELSRVTREINENVVTCIQGNGSKFIKWTAPSGFPVIYEAYCTRNVNVKSTIPGFQGGHTQQPGRITHVLQEVTDRPDIQKYQSGISPNFIHSMDATHMAGVISHWSGSFGAIHDSYSTHACDVEELSKLTREIFVKMYDIDDPYAAITEMVLSPCVYEEELPELGDLDIHEVRNSSYFFC